MSFQRKLRNLVEGPYGRWIMLGLLIFILAIFTVTQPMTQWIRGMFSDASEPDDVAGSFSVLPGERTDVTFREFDQARARYLTARTFAARSAIDRVPDTEVWTYLLLAEAARREGVQVSYYDVRRFLERLVPAFIWNDPRQYKRWVRQRYRVSAMAFEEAVREYLSAARVRELYQQSFLVGEPTTREAVVKQAASQNIEYARGSYAALDAGRFLEDAARELKAESDPAAKLGEFYDTDPWVKLENVRFKNPRRYRIELLYTIHGNVTDDATLQRIIDLFSATYPQLDVSRLEATIQAQKEYFRNYRDRLLAQAGSTWKDVGKEVAAEKEEEKPGEEPGEKKGGEEGEKPGEKDGDAKGAEDAAAADREDGAVTPALREKMWKYGFQIVREQVDRELRLRGMYQWFYDQARDDESLKKLFEKLKKQDDPDQPICSTEPGKGLIVYRDFDGQPLTGEELAEIEDSGVKFTYNFRARVTGLGDSDLPKKSRKADVLGEAGHGRQIFRLMEVLREQRKTFDELTPGERNELRDEFYLPAKARERAKETLEALRKRFVDGEVAAERFREDAEAVGARVHEDEWIVATYDPMEAPNPKFLWRDEYLHMRDRYSLRKHLADVLSRDRVKKELKEGSFLEVSVDTGESSDDPGAAYLYLLLERRKPDAETVPPSELTTYLINARRDKAREDQRRWSEKVEQIISDFNMVFYDDMRRRIDDELKRRATARRRRSR